MRINTLCSCVYFVIEISIMCASTQYSNFGCMLIPNVPHFTIVMYLYLLHYFELPYTLLS
jgi:hypothetical protein